MVPPDALFELVELGDAVLRTGATAEVPGPWGELLARCRRAIAGPGEALAAVTVEDDPAGLRLVHRGSEPLRVGLGALVATLVASRDGAEVGSASSRIKDGVVEAEPGWSLPINLDPIPADGVRRVASVSFSASDGGVWIPVLCEVVLGDRR